jgi:type II secretion system protein I
MLRPHKGFTLVELMVAVSILAIGITLNLRSFVNNAAALDMIKDRFAAMGIIENKMCDFKQKALAEVGIKPQQEEKEEVFVRQRKATLNSEIKPLDEEQLKDYVNEAVIRVSWQDENKDKYEELVVYLPNKK